MSELIKYKEFQRSVSGNLDTGRCFTGGDMKALVGSMQGLQDMIKYTAVPEVHDITAESDLDQKLDTISITSARQQQEAKFFSQARLVEENIKAVRARFDQNYRNSFPGRDKHAARPPPLERDINGHVVKRKAKLGFFEHDEATDSPSPAENYTMGAGEGALILVFADAVMWLLDVTHTWSSLAVKYLLLVVFARARKDENRQRFG